MIIRKELQKGFSKGLGIGLGILFIISILGLVYAVGFHIAEEILPGTFSGDFVFNGSVNMTQDLCVTGGECLYQNKSAFSVHRNGLNQIGIATSTLTTIDWTTEDFDINSEFDLSTNNFTAKIAGVYYFVVTSSIISLADGDASRAYIYKNGERIIAGTYLTRGSGGQHNSIATALIDIQVGDQVEARVWHNYGSNRDLSGNSYESHFSGVRIN